MFRTTMYPILFAGSNEFVLWYIATHAIPNIINAITFMPVIIVVISIYFTLLSLLALPNPFTCPHGRPTAIKLSKTDIEKKFARRK